MKKLRLTSKTRRAWQGKSSGFTLVEVVIAMLLLGIIAVAVLGSLSYASTVLIVADRKATAESLARTQMEYVKDSQCQYDKINNPPVYSPDLTDVPEIYNVYVDAIRLDPKGDGIGDDDGIQLITVTISYDVLRYNVETRGSELVATNFTLQDYKRNPEAE